MDILTISIKFCLKANNISNAVDGSNVLIPNMKSG